jgi:hypothetical protein
MEAKYVNHPKHELDMSYFILKQNATSAYLVAKGWNEV